jgi:hypothetical protein
MCKTDMRDSALSNAGPCSGCGMRGRPGQKRRARGPARPRPAMTRRPQLVASRAGWPRGEQTYLAVWNRQSRSDLSLRGVSCFLTNSRGRAAVHRISGTPPVAQLFLLARSAHGLVTLSPYRRLSLAGVDDTDASMFRVLMPGLCGQQAPGALPVNCRQAARSSGGQKQWRIQASPARHGHRHHARTAISHVPCRRLSASYISD